MLPPPNPSLPTPSWPYNLLTHSPAPHLYSILIYILAPTNKHVINNVFNLTGCALCRRPILPPCGYQKLSFGGRSASFLANRCRLCGPWAKQEEDERVPNHMLIDLGSISGSYFGSCLGFEAWNFNLFSGLLPGQLMHRFLG